MAVRDQYYSAELWRIIYTTLAPISCSKPPGVNVDDDHDTQDDDQPLLSAALRCARRAPCV